MYGTRIVSVLLRERNYSKNAKKKVPVNTNISKFQEIMFLYSLQQNSKQLIPHKVSLIYSTLSLQED